MWASEAGLLSMVKQADEQATNANSVPPFLIISGRVSKKTPIKDKLMPLCILLASVCTVSSDTLYIKEVHEVPKR